MGASQSGSSTFMKSSRAYGEGSGRGRSSPQSPRSVPAPAIGEQETASQFVLVVTAPPGTGKHQLIGRFLSGNSGSMACIAYHGTLTSPEKVPPATRASVALGAACFHGKRPFACAKWRNIDSFVNRVETCKRLAFCHTHAAGCRPPQTPCRACSTRSSRWAPPHPSKQPCLLYTSPSPRD